MLEQKILYWRALCNTTESNNHMTKIIVHYFLPAGSMECYMYYMLWWQFKPPYRKKMWMNSNICIYKSLLWWGQIEVHYKQCSSNIQMYLLCWSQTKWSKANSSSFVCCLLVFPGIFIDEIWFFICPFSWLSKQAIKWRSEISPTPITVKLALCKFFQLKN